MVVKRFCNWCRMPVGKEYYRILISGTSINRAGHHRFDDICFVCISHVLARIKELKDDGAYVIGEPE